jgi:hypothetical protein
MAWCVTSMYLQYTTYIPVIRRTRYSIALGPYLTVPIMRVRADAIFLFSDHQDLRQSMMTYVLSAHSGLLEDHTQ